MGRPTLVLVTGPAGSGKTTLASAVGAAVGCPVVSRDAIKEGMVATGELKYSTETNKIDITLGVEEITILDKTVAKKKATTEPAKK